MRRLSAAGLIMSEPFVPEHCAFPDGITIGKPTTVSGNSRTGHRARFGGVEIDGPCPYLHCARSKWVVTVEEYEPGPGPGDFVNEWNTPDEAIADILEYFFGDPKRMQALDRKHSLL